MGRSRQLGTFLMIGAAVQALVMTIGLMRRSYLVIALPVAIGVPSILTVGWNASTADW